MSSACGCARLSLHARVCDRAGDLHVCKCIQVQACAGDVRACLLCLANFDGCLKLGVSIFEDCYRLHCLVHAGVRRNDRADRLAVCEALSQSHKSLEK